MSIPSANQGIPEQQGGDPANLPSAQVAWDGVMENRLAQRYASIADRTARNAAPNEGELSHLADVDRYEVFNGAAWISTIHRNVYAFLRRTTNAAAINNSTVLVSDATLTSALAAATTYTYQGIIKYDCSTVADLKILLSLPGGSSGETCLEGLAPGAAGASGDILYSVTTASTTAFGGAGVGTPVFCKFWGRVTTVGAGNLVVQYAQQNAEATNLTVRTDSWLEVIARS